jgi:hypothetical protein
MICRYRRPNRASLQDPRTVYHVVELISIGWAGQWAHHVRV